MDVEQVAAALRPIGEGLEQDGYALAVRVAGGDVALRIVAGPSACEECLVPKDLMAALALQALGDAGLAPRRLAIAYPGA
jgi:hypothetical protein